MRSDIMFPLEIYSELLEKADLFETKLLLAYNDGNLLDRNTIEVCFSYRWRDKIKKYWD